MKKIGIVLALCTIILSGCQTVSRHFEKDARGQIVVTERYEDGTTTTEGYNQPKVRTLEHLGLKENQAVDLIANGTAYDATTKEPTTFGWIVIVIVIIILIIICVAAGSGGEVGFLALELCDDD